MEEITKAVLDALREIDGNVTAIDGEANTYGVEAPDGELYFVSIIPA